MQSPWLFSRRRRRPLRLSSRRRRPWEGLRAARDTDASRWRLFVPGIPTRRLRLLRLRRLLLLSCRFDTNHRLGHCIWQTCKFEGYFNVCSLHQIAMIVVHSGTVYHTILYCFIAHYSNNDCWLDKRNLFKKSIERQHGARVERRSPSCVSVHCW